MSRLRKALLRSASRLRTTAENSGATVPATETNVEATRELSVPDSAVVSHVHYDDGLMKVFGRNVDSLLEGRFVEAYATGMASGHQFRWGTGQTVDMPWRVYMACWAASHALNVPGDFVECGVHTGLLSLAICKYVDFNATGKSFYLFDTFSGIPEEQMTETERPGRIAENEEYYRRDVYDLAVQNFAPYPRAHLIRGKVPEALGEVQIENVSYLSLDMNIVAPEVAAIEFFWPQLSPAAVVLLDDYGWYEHREQKAGIDGFAARKGVPIATLPTGQGLLIKP